MIRECIFVPRVNTVKEDLRELFKCLTLQKTLGREEKRQGGRSCSLGDLEASPQRLAGERESWASCERQKHVFKSVHVRAHTGIRGLSLDPALAS